jgi:hypothetical protein
MGKANCNQICNLELRGVAHKEEELNLLSAELYPICHLLALFGSHHILHVSRIRVNICM